MFEVESQGILFDAATQPAVRRIAYFTSLCRLQSGRVLCGFQNGPGKHAATSRIGLCRSEDQGQTWTSLTETLETTIDGVPGSLGCGELVEVRPGRLLLLATWFDRSDPLRPLFDPVTQGILKSRQLMAVSSDDGLTWNKWCELPMGDLRGCALTGPSVRWDNGMIAIPFESFKEFDDPNPGHHAAWVLVALDGGDSFSQPLLVAQHPRHTIYYWDQRLCRGDRDGEFYAMFWTHNLAEQRDLNVHLRRVITDGRTMTCDSILETTIPGQIAAPLKLKNGRLLAFVVDRGNPGTMTLWSSPDNGLSWPVADSRVVYTHDERAAVTQGRENIDFRQYWEDMGKWSFGHPAIRELSDGKVLLAWYAGTPDSMSLHWARVCNR